MRYSKDLVRKVQESLPEEIKSIVTSQELLDATSSIAATMDLSMSQENILAYEIMMLMLGLTRADDFVPLLSKNLSITTDQTSTLIQLIKTQILSKIPEEVLHAQEEYAQAKLKEAGESALLAPTTVPEVTPNDLPEVVPGETAHDVPHMEAAAPTPQAEPQSIMEEKLSQVTSAPIQASPSYPGGKDPYREPLQ